MRRTGFPPAVKRAVYERCGGCCEVGADGCTVMASTFHHRRARGMGSTRRADTNSAANALAVCDTCHRRIESQRTEALAAGWLVPQNGVPADVPVMYRGTRILLATKGE